MTSPVLEQLGSGHMSPEAIMMWDQFGRVGNSEEGQAYNRVRETDEIQLIDVSGSDVYLGYAIPMSSISTAVWKIKRVNTNNPISIYYADGSVYYDKMWSSRASYTYS
jgi:hypothetical protein